MSNLSSNPLPKRTRYYSDQACKAIAGRISEQLRHYDNAKNLMDLSAGDKTLHPFIPVWGPDYDTAVEKINTLYHPDEAAIIIENLTA